MLVGAAIAERRDLCHDRTEIRVRRSGTVAQNWVNDSARQISYMHLVFYSSLNENELKFSESKLEHLCFGKEHLILEFCECLLLKNGFNINILYCMCNFSLK